MASTSSTVSAMYYTGYYMCKPLPSKTSRWLLSETINPPVASSQRSSTAFNSRTTMAPPAAATYSGISHNLKPGDKLRCVCDEDDGGKRTASSFVRHIAGCKAWKKALKRHNKKMKKEKQAARKAATRKKRKELSSESDGNSDESESDATPPKRKKGEAANTELPPPKRRSTPYSFIFGRNK